MLELFIAPTEIADAIPLTALSEYRAKKICSLRYEKSKKQSKAAGMLLAYALKKCFGIEEKNVYYAETERGKPYIPQYPDVHFSVTHTDGLCAVAVSDMPVGVDAEIRDKRRSEEIYALCKRFFSEFERRSYGLDDDTKELDTERIKGFYRIWTAKESFAKCTGEGLAEALHKIEIPFFEEKLLCDNLLITSFESELHTVTLCAYRDDAVKPENITVDTVKKAFY